jgi:hypothetical protein
MAILSAWRCKGNQNLKDFLIIVNGLVTMAKSSHPGGRDASPAPEKGDNPSGARPTEPQRRYLERGLTEPGGKLPLFDRDGREVPRKTIEACIAHGWAESWVANPIKPDWLVCRLTAAGYLALGAKPP